MSPLSRDLAIGAIIVALISLFYKPGPTPPTPDEPPPVVVDPQPTVPVQKPILVILDNVSYQSPATGMALADWEFRSQLDGYFGKERWRFWDDQVEPKTPEFQAITEAAKKEFIAPDEGGILKPAYAYARDGKLEVGDFEYPQFKETLNRWSKP